MLYMTAEVRLCASVFKGVNFLKILIQNLIAVVRRSEGLNMIGGLDIIMKACAIFLSLIAKIWFI